MKIISEMEKLGITLTDEQKEAIKKGIGEEVIPESDHQKKIQKAETERDAWKQKAETAEETLKGFEGKDFEQITKDRDEWKQKAEQAEKDFKEKMEKRDYSDAIKELTKDVKFSSNSAKKAFLADLEASPLQMRDGKILGFDDYLKNYQETDADAFVKDENPNRASFTGTINTGNDSSGADLSKMRAIMGLPAEKK